MARSAAIATPHHGTIRQGSARALTILRVSTLHLIAIVCGGLLMIPFAWAMISSLKPWNEIRVLPPTFWPSHFAWSNYPEVWGTQYFSGWAYNSVEITILATIGTVITAAMAGFAFARLSFPGRNLLFGLALSTLMLPQEVTLIPSYLLFFLIGWLNTYLPLIVPFWLGGSAFFIFLFRQFFMSIPKDLDEAAKIDGANYFQILGSIILPLSLPAMATAGIISFISNWNAFLFPLIILNDTEKFTLAIGLRYFAISPTADSKPLDHLLLAGSAIMTLPIVLIFFFGQRYFVRGVVMSGIKG
ncbi:MAG TPA: carbohydrate ABC transporter permease [Chloroflexota bacterium]|nr:carbohydrate ABC transporter permease [Chloroflexota bacterium]